MRRLSVWVSMLGVCLLGCGNTRLSNASVQIEVSPAVLDFGSVSLGESKTLPVVITNRGLSKLTIESMSVSEGGSAFRCEGCTATSKQLGSQEAVTVVIGFSPSDTRAAAGRLSVVSDAPNAPEVLVSLVGNSSSTCVTESDAAFCERLKRSCGSVTGTDNCGASRVVTSCGTCTGAQTCGSSNVCGCEAETDAQLCAGHAAECGALTVSDACGAMRVIASCGTCAKPSDTCGGGGGANQCGCPAESDSAMCARFSRNCGTFTGEDSCGISRTVASCGTCADSQTCGASNVCGCVAESDAALCARSGFVCGTLNATDNCGAARVVSSCGTCTAVTESCSVAGVCACAPESNVVLCALQGKTCGAAVATDRCGGSRTIASCGVCSTAPAHATPMCLATGACDFTCDSGYVKEGSACKVGCSGSWLTNAPFAAGSGTVADPYLICTAAQMNRVRDSLTSSYQLMADIDLAGVPFAPIGSASSGFRGSFNGGSHTISNWRYSNPAANFVGFFSRCEFGSSVTALRLSGVDVTGYDSVGGLTGAAFGAMTDVHVSGSVKGSINVGGLTGNNAQRINECSSAATVIGASNVGGLNGTDYGMTSDSSATGDVTGTGQNVGGLIGVAPFVMTVTRSFATGAVTGTQWVGGLVGNFGTSHGSIEASYATGSVTGTTGVGGLVGINGVLITNSYSSGAVDGSTSVGGLVGSNNSLIAHSYSRGSVSGTSAVGGLVGSNGTSPLALAIDSFWDTVTSGRMTSALGVGKTTAQLADAAPFSKWNTYSMWQIGAGYPTLLSTPVACTVGAGGFSGGTGDPGTPFLITSEAQLYNVECNLNRSFKLVNDLDFAGKPMVPSIGRLASKAFTGAFDGDNKSISNWVSYGGSAALFASVEGTIRDLRLNNAEIGGSIFVGTIAGKISFGASVTNVRSSGVVRGAYEVGGLVGESYGTISKSSSTAQVVAGTGGASAYVGGLIGYCGGGGVSNCFAAGSVNSLDEDVGGLVGRISVGVQATNSYSVGLVTKGSGFSSGSNATVTNCFWDTETSSKATSDYGSGKTTAEMKTQTTFTGWDFATIWQIAPGEYPTLR